MSVSSKRRETEVFSMAFLDCICCGFGSMILVFILTISQQQSLEVENVEEMQARVRAAAEQVTLTQQEADRILQQALRTRVEIEAEERNVKDTELKVSDRQRELMLLLQDIGAMKDARSVLLDDKKLLPTTEEKMNLPLPNPGQYLTGVNLTGEYILFLVRMSGSMLDETPDDAFARLSDPDYKKKQAPKWQRVVRSLKWMLASLGPETHFKIVLFNDEVVNLLPNRADEWLPSKDRTVLREVVTRLDDLVPKGGANLEKAFHVVRSLPRLPDNLVLLTDSLPTLSDSIPTDGAVGQEQRIRFFEVAARLRPSRVPVSTILFPFSGDPAAAWLYWRLAVQSNGALVSPSADWPDL
jgi:hypothetical protein